MQALFAISTPRRREGYAAAMTDENAALARCGPNARPRVYAALEALGVAHRTLEHPPIFTVEEGRELRMEMAGATSKNLFLVDRDRALTLVVAHGDRRADLKGLAKALGAAGRYSFGKPDLLEETLGVTPGSVCIFALLNDPEKRVATVAVDAGLLAARPVWAHPLDNAASTAIAPEDMIRFIRAQGREPVLVDIERPLDPDPDLLARAATAT